MFCCTCPSRSGLSVTSVRMGHALSDLRSIELSGPRVERLSRRLVCASAMALFLHDAATVGVSYTLRISYALMAIACVCGGRFVVLGWQRVPIGIRISGAVVILVYFASGIAGINPVLTSQSRGSSLRWVVYILDLGLGAASIGLLLGLFRDERSLRRLAFALALGAVIAAVYGAYQWLAQRYGWPLSNLDNAPNADNFSTGPRFQGTGLLGWERVRGTFTEPFAFGIYLAALLPIIALIALIMRVPRVLALVPVIVTVAALVLTDSSLAWTCLFAAVAVAGTAAFIGTGRPAAARVAGGLVAALLIVCVVAVAEPNVLAPATARSTSQLQATVGSRTSAWTEAAHLWSTRPVLGWGPGASSVELARPDPISNVNPAPIVLGSAYGLWAASLVDAGVLGLVAWMAFFGAVLAYVLSAAMRQRSLLLWAALVAMFTGALTSQVGGDRLDLRVWVLTGFALAAAHALSRRELVLSTLNSSATEAIAAAPKLSAIDGGRKRKGLQPAAIAGVLLACIGLGAAIGAGLHPAASAHFRAEAQLAAITSNPAEEPVVWHTFRQALTVASVRTNVARTAGVEPSELRIGMGGDPQSSLITVYAYGDSADQADLLANTAAAAGVNFLSQSVYAPPVVTSTFDESSEGWDVGPGIFLLPPNPSQQTRALGHARPGALTAMCTNRLAGDCGPYLSIPRPFLRGVTYTAAGWVQTQPGVRIRLVLGSSAGNVAVGAISSGTSQWQRLSVQWLPRSNSSKAVAAFQVMSVGTSHLAIDDVEVGPRAVVQRSGFGARQAPHFKTVLSAESRSVLDSSKTTAWAIGGAGAGLLVGVAALVAGMIAGILRRPR
jgi:hypothetical protein